MLNNKIFFRAFVEVFFYNLKESHGMTLPYLYKDWETNLEKMFLTYNNLTTILKTIKKGNNSVQRLRVYSILKYAVSIKSLLLCMALCIQIVLCKAHMYIHTYSVVQNNSNK